MLFTRSLCLIGFLACTAFIGVALYFEHVMGLEPCPLCMVQRLLIGALGLVFLVGAVHGPRGAGRRFYGLLSAAVAVVGAVVAGRHVWLQSLPPDQVPECGPGLEFMLETNTVAETLRKVLQGSGECAEVAWTFVGLSIPGWTLVAFCVLAAFGLYLLFAPTWREIRTS